MSSQIEVNHCPVGDTDRPQQYLGSAEAISGYDVSVWECQVCTALIHIPDDGAAPFDRHRQVNCPIECLGQGTDALDL